MAFHILVMFSETHLFSMSLVCNHNSYLVRIFSHENQSLHKVQMTGTLKVHMKNTSYSFYLLSWSTDSFLKNFDFFLTSLTCSLCFYKYYNTNLSVCIYNYKLYILHIFVFRFRVWKIFSICICSAFSSCFHIIGRFDNISYIIINSLISSFFCL